MSYERFEEEIGRVLRKHWTKRDYIDPQGQKRTAEPRIISLDMETAPSRGEFLTNERILAIAIAKRVSGEFMSDEGIEVKSWLLSKDSDEREYTLLENFDKGLKPRPLATIGFGIKGYDLPLLSIKMQRYNPEIATVKLRIPAVKKLWSIIDMLERAVHLDLVIRLRFKLGVSKFDEVLDHEGFLHLPLRKVKHPTLPEGVSLGEYGYTIWREKPEDIKTLVEAHAHDVFLIAEHEFFHNNSSESKKYAC